MPASRNSVVSLSLMTLLLLASIQEASSISRPTSSQVQFGTSDPITCENPDYVVSDVSLTAQGYPTSTVPQDSGVWTLISSTADELVNVNDTRSQLFDMITQIPSSIQECPDFYCPDTTLEECVMCGNTMTKNGKDYQCQVWNGVANWEDTSLDQSSCGCNCYSTYEFRLLENNTTDTDSVMASYLGLKRRLFSQGATIQDVISSQETYEDAITTIFAKDTPSARQASLLTTTPVETRNGFKVDFQSTVDSPWCQTPISEYVGYINLNPPLGLCYNLENDGPTCFSSSTDVFSEYIEGMDFSNCGGEGFAFVVRSGNSPLIDSTNGQGSGLGYAGLQNVLAIEFDFKYSNNKNDPSTAKYSRHISLIIKKDAADAVETVVDLGNSEFSGALAWNDDPINMGDNPTSKDLVQETVDWTIEFVNQQFYVYSGGSNKQLEWSSTKFSFQDYFDTDSSSFYMGFTSSASGNKGHNIKIGQFSLSTRPEAYELTSFFTAPYVTSSGDQSAPKAQNQFSVAYTILDNCFNPITDQLQSSSLTLQAENNDCTGISMFQFDSQSTQYIFTIGQCATEGTKNFTASLTISGNVIALPDITIDILPPKFNYLELEFADAENGIGQGTTTSPAYFSLKPYYKNGPTVIDLSTYTTQLVLESDLEGVVTIKSNSKNENVESKYIFIEQMLGDAPFQDIISTNMYMMYASSIAADTYTVSSSLFGGASYQFKIAAGESSSSQTQIYVTDSLPDVSNTADFQSYLPIGPSSLNLVAGTTLSIIFDLKDSNGAQITQNTNVQTRLSFNGQTWVLYDQNGNPISLDDVTTSSITSANYLSTYFKQDYTFTIGGLININPIVNGDTVGNCQFCYQITILADSPLIQYSENWMNQGTSWLKSSNDLITITNSAQFMMLKFRDQYFNYVNDPKDNYFFHYDSLSENPQELYCDQEELCKIQGQISIASNVIAPLNVCWSAAANENGEFALQICNSDIDIFNNLVRSSYTLNIYKYTRSSLTASWTQDQTNFFTKDVQIISPQGGSLSSQYGNGPVYAGNTRIYTYKSTQSYYMGYQGDTNIIQNNQQQGSATSSPTPFKWNTDNNNDFTFEFYTDLDAYFSGGVTSDLIKIECFYEGSTTDYCSDLGNFKMVSAQKKYQLKYDYNSKADSQDGVTNARTFKFYIRVLADDSTQTQDDSAYYLAWELPVYINPQAPYASYINLQALSVAKSCPDQNCLVDIVAGSSFTFELVAFDKYNSPTTYDGSSTDYGLVGSYVDSNGISRTLIDYEVEIQDTEGTYYVTITPTGVGIYTWTSIFFSNCVSKGWQTDNCIESYTQNVESAPVNYKNSIMELMDIDYQVEGTLTAGDTLTFWLSFEDEYENNIPISKMAEGNYAGVSFSYTADPSTSYSVPANTDPKTTSLPFTLASYQVTDYEVPSDLKDSWKDEFNTALQITVTRAYTNTFAMNILDGASSKPSGICEKCSSYLEPNVPSAFDFFQIQGTTKQYQSSDTFSQIDCSTSWPKIYLEAKDQWDNVHDSWPTGFTDFEIKLQNNEGTDLVTFAPASRVDKGIAFVLTDAYYQSGTAEYTSWTTLPSGNYNLIIHLEYMNANTGDTTSFDYTKTLPINGGSEAYSVNEPTSFTNSAQGGLTFQAGQNSGIMTITLMSPSTDDNGNTVNKPYGVLFKNLEQMVKLVLPDSPETEDENLEYTVTQPSMGVLQFSLNHTIKGTKTYQLRALADDYLQQSGSYAISDLTLFDQAITVNVLAGEITTLRFFSNDNLFEDETQGLFYATTTDYSRFSQGFSIFLSPYDFWGNSVEQDAQYVDDLLGNFNIKIRDAETLESKKSNYNLRLNGDPEWSSDDDETQVEVQIKCVIPLSTVINIGNPAISFAYKDNDGNLNMVDQLSLTVYSGVPKKAKCRENLVKENSNGGFDDDTAATQFPGSTTLSIDASNSVKFILYLRDRFGNPISTIQSNEQVEAFTRMRANGQNAFDPSSLDGFQVFEVSEDINGDISENQPTDKGSQVAPSISDIFCKDSSDCITWTWSIYSSSIIGLESTYTLSTVNSDGYYKVSVAPGAPDIEKMEILVQCRSSTTLNDYMTLMASGLSSSEANSAINVQSSDPWIYSTSADDFLCDTTTSPLFNIVFLDQWGNQAVEKPDTVSQTQMNFGTLEGNDFSTLLVWCAVTSQQLRRRVLTSEGTQYPFQFQLCEDASDQTIEYTQLYGDDYPPSLFWYSLSGNQDYGVSTTLTDPDGVKTTKYFSFGVVSSFDSESETEGSELEFSPENSVIAVDKIVTVPGSTAKLQFELRTIDADLRYSQWIYPTSQISLSSTYDFDDDPIVDKVYIGAPGDHYIEVSSLEEFTEDDPNYITVKAWGYELAGGKVVEWVNEATCQDGNGDYVTDEIGVSFWDPLEKTEISQPSQTSGIVLPANTTDFDYTINFEAYQVYEDLYFKCPLTTSNVAKVSALVVTDPNGDNVDFVGATLNQDGRGSFKFTPEKAGVYTITLNSEYTATVSIAYGSLSSQTSTVEIVSSSQSTPVFAAQESLSIRVYPMDQYENPIPPTEDIVYQMDYYFSNINDNSWQLLPLPSGRRLSRSRVLVADSVITYNSDDNSFDITFSICDKGTYNIKATMANTEIDNCLECQFTITPGDMDFSTSKLLLQDPTTQTFYEWTSSLNVQFQNTQAYPNLRLYPIDSCGNGLDDFPATSDPVLTITDNDESLQIFTDVNVDPNGDSIDPSRDYLILITSQSSETSSGVTDIFYTFQLQGVPGLADDSENPETDDTKAWETGANGDVLFTVTTADDQVRELNGQLVNNFDGDNAPISATYSSPQPNQNYITTVGKTISIDVQLRSTNNLDKLNAYTSFIQATAGTKDGDDTCKVSVTPSTKPGLFSILVYTETEYYHSGDSLSISLYYQDPDENQSQVDVTGAAFSLTFMPGSLSYYVLQNDSPLPAQRIGTTYTVSFKPYDSFDNLAIAQDTNYGITVYAPVTVDEVVAGKTPKASLKATIDDTETVLSLAIDVERVSGYSTYTGEYTISSEYFQTDKDSNDVVEYSFVSQVGNADATTSSFTVDVSETLAGDIISGFLLAKDFLGNIIPTSVADYSVFTVEYTSASQSLSLTYPGDYASVSATEDGHPDTIKFSVNETVVGTASFSIIYQDGSSVSQTVTCSSPATNCQVTVNPNVVFIPHTNVLTTISTGLQKVTNLLVNEGEEIEFKVVFNDIFHNTIPSLNSSELFGATLSHNTIQWQDNEFFDFYSNDYVTGMTSFTVQSTDTSSTSGGVNLMLIEEDDSERSQFIKSLVPADGYQVTVAYFVDEVVKGEVVLGLTVDGDNSADSDGDVRGNGRVNEQATELIQTDVSLIAGEAYSFTIQLKTDDNKLYSNVYPDFDATKDVSVAFTFDGEDVADASIQDLVVQDRSKLVVPFSFTVARYDRPLTASVTINGIVMTYTLQFFVYPNSPDHETTEIVQDFPSTVEMLDTIYVKLMMKDSYGNNITDLADMSNTLSTEIVSSKGLIMDGPLGYGNGIFGFQYQPSYPPSLFQVNILWKEDNLQYTLNSELITTTVYTKLDPDNFKLTSSSNLMAIESTGGATLNIYAENQAQICYSGEEDLALKVNLVGPYESNNPAMTQLSSTEFTLSIETSTAVTDNEGCQYYQFTFEDEALQTVGYYDVQVFMTDQDQYNTIVSSNYQQIHPDLDISTTPLISFRAIQIIPGPVYAPNTLIFRNQIGRGTGPDTVEADDTVSYQVATYDKFNNKYTYDSWTGQLSVSELTSTEGEVSDTAVFTVNKLDQGEFSVQITIPEANEYNNMKLMITESGPVVQTAYYLDLTKENAPKSYIVQPGSCSSAVPGIESTEIEQNGVYIGDRTYVTIQCMDKYGNKLETGGEVFSAEITGTELESVGTDKFNGTLQDNSNGTYSVIFVAPYSGNYQLVVTLKQAAYGSPVSFTASQKCTDALPTQCPVSNLCESSYYGCSSLDSILNEDECPDSSQPIYCLVGGTNSCVESVTMCDCDSGYERCSVTGVCVASSDVNTLCPVKADYACDSGTVKCDDGTCRTNLENCASEYVCPPGTKQCADLSCVLDDESCPDFPSCTEDSSSTNFYKCWDQTCASSPEECPTQITCLSGQYVCPDSTCKDSSLECNLPTECVLDMMFKCADQSCRNTLEDCPQRTTCAKGKALCADGTCQDDCILHTLQSLSRRLQESKDDDSSVPVADSTKIICPSGEEVTSSYLCPSADTCPDGQIKCNDGSCNSELSSCPVSTCENGQFLCNDGTCSDTKDTCATRVQCPNEVSVKCPDGTCASSISSCATPLTCPEDTPYKCGTSGECRRSYLECPVGIVCPEDLPIKCVDNSCVSSPSHCIQISLAKVAPNGYITCPDGSFSTSLDTCPSTSTCAPGFFRCVDGSCAEDISTCQNSNSFVLDVIEASTALPYRCPDGSFQSSFTNCPTIVSCPNESPTLCDDGNCRQSKTQCTPNTECGLSMTQCPDGTCTKDYCSTQITCSVSAPYKCYDNTCRVDPDDCPQKTCPDDQPILCTDGTCQSDRIYCVALWDACPQEKPVRCPDSECYESASECNSISECPSPLTKCQGGECMLSQDDCPVVECPTQTPYKCSVTGSCVTSEDYCENSSNGCQHDKPHKCLDGSCVSDVATCPDRSQIDCDTESQTLCPNGACIDNTETCPNVFGCPDDEKKCADGNCIQSNEECSVAICPDTMIKCPDGMCMSSNAYCRDFSQLNSTICDNNPNGFNVPCANGQCVSSSEQCTPLFPCDSNEVRCNDGSCNIAALCPLAKTCPEGQERCDSGACADSLNKCPNELGCPEDTPYKCVSGSNLGLCVANINTCDLEIFTATALNTGECTVETPYKCLDGSCAYTPDICVSRGYGCSEEAYVCPDGTCKDSSSECSSTSNGCPLEEPFKCADGTCKKYQTDLYGDGQGCTPEIVCQDYQPFQCMSGECVGDPELCQSVTKEVEFDESCPAQSSPVMCSLGYCFDDVIDCLGIMSASNCPKTKPFYCAINGCVATPGECLSTMMGERILEEGQIQCPADKPAQCYDGSCMTSYSLCPIYPGCTSPELPYKCGDGQCASSGFMCSEDPVCEDSFSLCVDGVCRDYCEDVPFNGCSNDLPLKCPDNSCAKTLSECAGNSNCNNDNLPFRCSTGNCVTDFSECDRTSLSYMSESFTLSVSPDITLIESFIIDSSTLVKNARITVPSGALLSPLDSIASQKTLNNTQLKFTPVAYSTVQHASNPLDLNGQTLARFIFPNVDESVSSSNAIRSAIIKLESSGRVDANEYYRFPLVLEMKIDTMASSLFDPNTQLCLGTLVETNTSSTWNCASRKVQNQYDATTGYIGFTVPNDGVYAVIFNPTPSEVNDINWCAKSLLCSNRWLIMSVFLFLVVILLPLTYIFWRMYRYVLKYRESQKKIDNIHNRYDEVMNTSTDTPFQSVKDKLEGILFRKNPLLRQEEQENEEITSLRKNVEKVDSDRKMLDAERKELMDKHNFYSREISRLRAELEGANRKRTVTGGSYGDSSINADSFL